MSYDAIQHPNPKFLGYCPKMPFKAGDVVRIPKGTPVLKGHKVARAKRDYDVTVHTVMLGQIATGYALYRYHGRTDMPKEHDSALFPWRNPTIRWVGSGGYWCEADVNFLIPVEDLPAQPMEPAYKKLVNVAMAVSDLSPRDTEFSNFAYRVFCWHTDFSADVPALLAQITKLRDETTNDTVRTQCDLVLAEMKEAA